MKVLFGMLLGAIGLIAVAAAAEYISKKKVDEVDKVDEADNTDTDTATDTVSDDINVVEEVVEDVVENDTEDDVEDDTEDDLYDDDDDEEEDELEQCIVSPHEPELFERVFLSIGTMIPVNDLDVPNVIKNRFRHAGLDRIPADVSQKELLEISGIGQNYANKVIDAVKKYQEEKE